MASKCFKEFPPVQRVPPFSLFHLQANIILSGLAVHQVMKTHAISYAESDVHAAAAFMALLQFASASRSLAQLLPQLTSAQCNSDPNLDDIER